MLLIRSLAFNVAFYLNLLVHLAAGLPTFFLPWWTVIVVAKSWARVTVWLLKVICGTRLEITGLEKIPPGPLIVASKHQSAWETIALLSLFDAPLFIFKRELLWLPFFGWMLWKGGMIPIERSAGSQALVRMTKRAREEIPNGRQLIIFPEGTRRTAGAEASYKFGVAHLYAEVGVPCLPVALNSGLFWPRRSLLRYPGTIRVEFLDIIPPHLDKQDFFQRMRSAIETASDRLYAEGKRELAARGYTRTDVRSSR